MVGALKWEFIAPIIPRLILIAFTICQPLMVRRFLDYLLDPHEMDNQNVGYGMIGAYFVVYSGMAVLIPLPIARFRVTGEQLIHH